MNTLEKILGIGTIIVTMAACGYDDKEPVVENVSDNYVTDNQAMIDTKISASIEGKIIKVQPSNISFTGDDQNQSVYASGAGRTSSNHEFEYLIIEDKDKNIHTLIYPYSKAIIEKDAIINYIPLKQGWIDSNTFVDMYLKPEYFSEDNILIEAEGLITKDGIRYK